MDFNKSEYYLNRELSWLEFNARVLEEAIDKNNRLLERIKFLAISASNFDEYFMVRVAGLMQQVEFKVTTKDPAGLTPKAQLDKIRENVHNMVTKQYSYLYRSILPSLEKENVTIKRFNELNDTQKEFVVEYFNNTVYPILTPMAIDQSRPFPLLNNKTLNFLIELKEDEKKNKAKKDKKNAVKYAVMQVPTVIKRIIVLPTNDDNLELIFLEEIIRNQMESLFIGQSVLNVGLFRITRSSDFDIDEDETHDLLHEIEKSIKLRKWGAPVRLEIEKHASSDSKKYLMERLELQTPDVYEINGILDLTICFAINGIDGFEHLKNEVLKPMISPSFITEKVINKENKSRKKIDSIDNIAVVDANISDEVSIFDIIRNKDVMLHHPYETFDHIEEFISAAANDPDVLAIKQTLYRVSGNSPIVHSLIKAAENGKQVTVVVELKARFDEENNINWAKKMEKAGCYVVYGLVGLKTHCKMCLVVRKDSDGIRRYVHLGTGNYNDSTAKIYTDLGIFTSNETFGQDVSGVFNLLTGYSKDIGFNKILAAPLRLRDGFLSHIKQEEENAKAGKPAHIVAKMNSLVDVTIIKALYSASCAGVKIDLIVRGICCLKSGIDGVSENINVVSVVDRFLEHSRIYYFHNDGTPKVFLSSADWMQRNLDRRVELLFPVESKDLMGEIKEILDTILSDTVKLRVQKKDGSYEPVEKRGKAAVHSQLIFYEKAKKAYESIALKGSL